MILFLVLRCFSFSKEITAGDSYFFLPPIPIFASSTIQVLDLTLNVTTVHSQVVERSVTSNSLSKDYPHPDDHAKQITDTLRFKPFTYRNTSSTTTLFKRSVEDVYCMGFEQIRGVPNFFLMENSAIPY